VCAYSPLERTVRSARLVKSQAACDVAYGKGKVEVVVVDDIAAGDFTEALKGLHV
jgi:hypothetical protein